MLAFLAHCLRARHRFYLYPLLLASALVLLASLRGAPLPSACPPGGAKAAALVFFGKAGFLSQADRSLAPSAAAARAGYDSVLAHLVLFNAQRGWCIDTFFHTWDV
jgi:hypothetical protein